MSLIKKPYEISVWEDVIVYVGVSGAEYSSISEMSEAVKYQYYTERELAIIGSSTMTSPARTINNVFKKNINGLRTLTFDMYYQYEDLEQGKVVRNPLIDLVIDERKVKLHYDNEWYDFIVKKDDEKGRDYKYSFTCTDLAINELGKTGFNIELDAELGNNMGTVQELALEVLRDSDWLLARETGDIIQLTNEEALYSLTLTGSITNVRKLDDSEFDDIPSNARIYAYYTPYVNLETNYFLFIYVLGDTGSSIPDLLEDKVTINCNNTRTYDLYAFNVKWNNDRPSFVNNSNKVKVSLYRGLRYVRKLSSIYDPVLRLTVLEYTGKNDNKTYYGYTTTEYIDSTTVENYVYNSTNFSGTSYWSIHGANDVKSIVARVFPGVDTNNTSLTRVGYLVAKFGEVPVEDPPLPPIKLVNDGILLNYSRINRFDKGDVYRLKISIGTISGNKYVVPSSIPINCLIRKYDLVDSDSNITTYFNSSNSAVTKSGEYFIIDMTCLLSATWESLKLNVGIFFFLKDGSDVNAEYYIKDVLFYRKVIGDNNHVLEPGETPTARIKTLYHFYNLDLVGKSSPEDYEYAESDPSSYTPVFGSGNKAFEKVRSITEKESNRFNLLLTLSETFECWVKFKIEHETNGLIKTETFPYYNPVNLTSGPITDYYIYDWSIKDYRPATGDYNSNLVYYKLESRTRLIKKVIFYQERLVDNYAGFKYGINLKDNNRTLDSELIVTKIIVKDNSCEAAENGFCSIARAEDNPTKENFAYNFDYYTSQGIISLGDLNNDLYLLGVGGSIGLYPRLAKLNKKRNELISSAAPLANSISDLSSKYLVATLTYHEAEKDLLRMKDSQSGTIYQYTHYVFDDFYNLIGRKANNLNVPSYPNEIYYINKTGVSNITANSGAGALAYYEVTKDTSPVSGKTYYYISESKFIKLNNNKFRDECVYYEKLDSARYTANTYFLTGSNTTKLNFTVSSGTSPEIYIYNAARRRMDNLGAEDFINDNFTISTLEKIVTLSNNKNTAAVDMEKYRNDLNATLAQYDSILDLLKEIAQATDEIEREFNIKYARYILEGSWTDDNYMDDDLYYLDALAVLYLSAYPKVSYNFKVIDLSLLEGYELYKFDIGYKTYVEDTEFFGYWTIDGLPTPVKEQVVVTEATLNLDEPEKNDLKVLNYKTHFEDLFQRITAATQSLEYHSGEYGRAAAAISPDGTVTESVMQRSLATAAYIIQNSHDLSVVWDDTGILATNLSDPAQITRLASAGLLVSADGGKTWGVAISGYGINTNYLTAGLIDADKINIMSGAYPTFKWDGLGLRAYGFTIDDNGIITSYDPSRYVVYDRFGIYGVNGLTNANFLDLVEVKNNAIFGLTWNGLFIKSLHRDGYVSIDSLNDITLREYFDNNGIRLERIRGKFGLLSSGDPVDPGVLSLGYINPDTHADANGNWCVRTDYIEVLGGTKYKFNTNMSYIMVQSFASNTPGSFIEKTAWVGGRNYSYVTPSSTKYIRVLLANTKGSGQAITPENVEYFTITSPALDIYGLALYDGSGRATVETKSTGTLWLKSLMDIGEPGIGTTTYIGVGQEATAEEMEILKNIDHGKKVISVHGAEDSEYQSGGEYNVDRFAVFEDGFVLGHGEMQLAGVDFPSGTIGSLSITEIPKTLGIRIIQNDGDTFRLDETGEGTPWALSFNRETSFKVVDSTTWKFGYKPSTTSEPYTMDIIPSDEENNIILYYYANSTKTDIGYNKVVLSADAFNTNPTRYYYYDSSISDYTHCTSSSSYVSGRDYYIKISELFSGGLAYLRCEVLSGDETYQSQISIKLERDGRSADAYTYYLESSEGYIINTNETTGNTTLLTANFYKNGEKVNWSGHTIHWYYKKDDNETFLAADLKNADYSEPDYLFKRVRSDLTHDYMVILNYLNLNSIQIYFTID